MIAAHARHAPEGTGAAGGVREVGPRAGYPTSGGLGYLTGFPSDL